MSFDRDAVFARAPQLRLLVIGDAAFECTLTGTSQRLCREAPVPIVDVQTTHCSPIGAAAVAAELAALGARTTFLSATGDNDDGELFLGLLRSAGIGNSFAVEPGRRMTARHRVVSGTQMLLRFDNICTTPLEPSTEAAIIQALEQQMPAADAVVLAEPFRELSTPTVMATLARLLEAGDTPCVSRGLSEATSALRPRPMLPSDASDRTMAFAALAMAAGSDPEDALTLALDARREPAPPLAKVTGRAELAAIRNRTHATGGRVVFTNGCFDIIHSGHTSLLRRARDLGAVLVVGLNTDESVQRLKGPGRPINTLADRAEVIGALACVDYVVPFAEDTPAELIRALRPDIFVKGGDYTEAALPEANLVRELGGRVEILSYVADHSTTGIIERIGQLQEAGALS